MHQKALCADSRMAVKTGFRDGSPRNMESKPKSELMHETTALPSGVLLSSSTHLHDPEPLEIEKESVSPE